MRHSTFVLLVVLLAASPSLAGPIALVPQAGTGGLRSNFSGTIGQVFKTGVGLSPTVGALGFFDEGGDGFATGHQVGLWQSGGPLIASVDLQAGTASRLYGEFRYESIAPVTLAPDTYYIVGATVTAGSGQDGFRDHNVQLPAWDPYFTGTQATNTRAARWGYGFVEPANQGNLNSAYGPANLLSEPLPPLPATSLAGYWNFDDPSDPGKDVSGNGHPVTFAGNADRTTDTAARGGASVRLDGNGSWIQTTGAGLPDREATMSLWIKLDEATPTDPNKTGFANTGGSGTTSHHPWTNGQGYYGVFRANNRAEGVNLAAADRAQWHHMAITTEPGTGTYHVYQNGQPVRQMDPGTFDFSSGSSIGSSGSTFHMQGYVDELAFYSEARSVGQVRAEYVLGIERQDLARVISLADIVGGGDGYGTGSNRGINPTNGQAATSHFSGNFTTDNTYHPVPGNALVDGVFIPDGGAGPVQITSTGLSVTLPDTNGLSWDSIWNGPNIGVTNNTLNTVNFASAQHEMIGFHINKGITFDLDAIREATPALDLLRFMAVVGSTNGSSNFQVYLDGVEQQSVSGLGYIDLPLAKDQRFLTITSINGGWTLLGDPQLIGRIPEPHSAAALLAGACVALLPRRRRRCRGRRASVGCFTAGCHQPTAEAAVRPD